MREKDVPNETPPESEQEVAADGLDDPGAGTDLAALPDGATGEPVAPGDPRAEAEINAMLAQVVGPEPSAQEILQAIVGGDDLPESNALQSQAGIVARILAADDSAGVLDMGEPTKAEDLEQVELTVSGVRWMRSTFEEGPGVYAVIDALRGDSGDSVKVTCGGVNVMTQLLRLQTMHAFPQKVKIVKATRPTKSGYYPYWLQPA